MGQQGAFFDEGKDPLSWSCIVRVGPRVDEVEASLSHVLLEQVVLVIRGTIKEEQDLVFVEVLLYN